MLLPQDIYLLSKSTYSPAVYVNAILKPLLGAISPRTLQNKILYLVPFLSVLSTEARTQCNLTNPGLGLATCHDNGTPNDPSDDFYTFPLNPQGTNLGSGYLVTVSNGTILPPTGNYGGPSIFTLSGVPPGNGVIITVTDNEDPNCSTFTILNPPPCSTPPCSINFLLVGNITCNDNGTPSDPDDDTFTIDVIVTGTNVSPGGWTASDPLNTSGQYDVLTVLGPYPISGGGFVLIATDNDDPGCTTIPIVIQPPSPCSNTAPCNIEDAGLFSVSCVNAETPDPSDDYAAFTLNPTGINLGTLYTVTISPGMITPTQGVYGVSTSFFTEPGLIPDEFIVTITDQDDPGCTFTFTLANPCSGLCAISATGTLPACDDNGTPSDPSDDTFTFDVLVFGTNTGPGWTANDPNNSSGLYNVVTTLGPYPISGGTLFITLTDDNDPGCQFTFNVDPPSPCSNACNLQEANLGTISCNDNGTPFDPSDDVIEFTLDPSGQNIGSTYTVSSPSGPITPNSGNYGSPVVFQTSPGTAGNGSIQLTIGDVNSPGCTLTITLTDPGDCAVSCDIDPILQNVECQDNGTPSIPGDDIFTATIVINGTGSGWAADDPGNSTGMYGASVVIGPFAIADGPVTLTFTSLDDPNCQQVLIVDPPLPCSAQCSLQADVTDIQCLDNGTPSDPSDDTFTFLLTVTGANTGPGWTANDPNNSSGLYNVVTTLGPYPISGGPLFMSLTDDNDPGCQFTFNVDPPSPCSNTCNLQEANLGTISCNNHGTPFDPSDDVIEFTLDPSGQNIGIIYTVSSPSGPITPNTGNYGSPIVFQTSPGTAGNGSIQLTITDVNSPGCTLTLTLSDPGDCATFCDLDLVLQNIECQDNGTPSIPGDDIFTATIVVNGTGSGWEADDPGNSTGMFGETLVIGPFAIVNGSVTLTVTSLDDPDCQQVLIVDPPLPCSVPCSLQADVTDIQCQDNGTPSDTSDDTFTFLLTVTGINAGATWIAAPPANATGVYQVPTLIGPFSTDQPTLTFTVSDSNDSSCNVNIDVASPGSCSSGCATADSTFINLASCNPLDTGMIIDQFVASDGCDSLVIISTRLLLSDTTRLFNQSCNPQDTGRTEILFTNQFDCDSLVITTTTIALVDTTVLFSRSCNPQDTGTTEVLFTNQFGCDSLVITTTAFALVDTTLLFSQSCNPQDTGRTEVLLTNQFGCDSLVIISTSLAPLSSSTLSAEVCFGESLVINGTTYDITNPMGTDTLIAANGCDSLVFIDLQFSNPPAFERIDTTLCVGEALIVNGQVYTENLPGGIQIISGRNGCDSVQIEITLTFVQLEIETQVNQPICQDLPGQIFLESVFGGTLPYSYQLNGEPAQIIDTLPLELGAVGPGSYTLNITDRNGCSDQQDLLILEGPEPVVDLGGDITLNIGDQQMLNPVINFDYDSLIWAPLSILDCAACLNPTVSSSEDVSISLTAVNAEGCVAEDVILLTIARDLTYYAPNIFSPNGDGINDAFTIFGDQEQLVLIRSLTIFDRWGNQVFEESGLIPGESSQGWDGSFRGSLLNPGVFVFVAELELNDGNVIPIKGDITLIR